MFKEISLIFWKILRPFNKAHNEFKQQFAYEIADVSFCPEKNKHIIEIKVSGKAKSDFYDAQDVASDDHFINGFSAKDVRTSVYLATCDKLSENQKFDPLYRLFRPRNNENNREKYIGIENIITGKKDIKPLNEILHSKIFEKFHLLDIYQLGYLAGQEKTAKVFTHVNIDGKSTFSYDPSHYTNYRPQYPKELFEFLSKKSTSPKMVLDCGSGSGQATEGLSRIFEHVIAVDASNELLSKAKKLSNVTYIQSLCEKLPLASNSIDLICVAQAIHWFQLETFYEEVKRILKPGGIIAVFCYNQATISTKVDEIVANIYEQVKSNENITIERQYVYDAYETLPFPFKKILSPSFKMTVRWNYNQWLEYMKTWPSILEYEKKFNINLVENSKLAIRHAWENEDEKEITWSIYLKVGQTEIVV